MDLTIANTIVGGLLLAVGWIGKQFWEMLKQARGRRKSEVQKLTEQRDEYRLKAERYYNRKQRLKDVLWETRRVSVEEYHVPQSALPDVPPDDH